MKATAKILAVMAVIGLVTSSFGASLTLGTTARSNGSNGGAYQASNSGLSTASYSSLSAATATSFETFCLEPTEYFTPGNSYNYTIASEAVGGALNTHGGSVGDALSIGTAWLYSQFAKGTLAGYNYGTDAQRAASNLLLQRAFWYLEDDFGASGQYNTSTLALDNPFLSLVTSALGSGATDALKLESVRTSAAAGQYGVYVLNLTSWSGQTLVQNQSQLYYSVPEGGATAGLLGLSFLAVAAIRRRFIR